jgi:hypothetical protein
VDSTTSTTFTQGNADRYLYLYLNLNDYGSYGATAAPITLESVMASTNSSYHARGQISCSPYTVFSPSTNATTPTMVRVSATASDAKVLNRGNCLLQINSEHASATAYLYKSSLYLKLSNVYKGKIFHQFGRYAQLASSSTVMMEHQRMYFHENLPTSTTISYYVTMKGSANRDCGARVRLGASDSGTGTSSLLIEDLCSGSCNDTKRVVELADRLESTLRDGDRLLSTFSCGATDSATIFNSYLMYDFKGP